MNKFTKISATALFALFLTACDKPADKPAPAKPETTQPAPEAKQEAAKLNLLKRLNLLKLHQLKNKLTTTNYLNGMQAKRKLKWLHNKNFNLI